MAPTLVASYFVQQNTTAGTALTTPSFTPANGEVIVVKLGTWTTTTSMGAPTGGSQTYTSRIIDAPGGFNAWVGIYTAVISGSPGSMTISSTPSASARYSMTVERWSGAQLAASPSTNSANGAGAPSGGLIASAGSIISWCSADVASIDPSSRAYLGSGTDEGVRDGHTGSNGVEYYGYLTATGGFQNFGLSLPTGQTYVIVGIEVQASAAAAAPPPQPSIRRRGQAQAVARAGRRTGVTKAVLGTQPPPPTGGRPARRKGPFPARRARLAAVTPPQVVVARPARIASPARYRLRGLLRPHGRGAQVIPAQAAAPPPSYVPPAARLRSRFLRSIRPRSGSVPVVQLLPPAQSQTVRARPRGIFRSRFAAAPPPQTLAPAPTYIPATARLRARFLRTVRPRAAQLAPPQTIAPAPSYVPQPGRVRLRMLRARPRSAQVVAPQTVPPPPVYVPPPARTHGRPGRPPRSHGAQITPLQVVAPAPQYVPQPGRVRERLARAVRPRSAAVTPAQPVIVPQRPPSSARSGRRFARIFRGVARFAGWPAASAPPIGTSSPNPALITSSKPLDLTTTVPLRDVVTRSAAGDLVTRTSNRDLEA